MTPKQGRKIGIYVALLGIILWAALFGPYEKPSSYGIEKVILTNGKEETFTIYAEKANTLEKRSQGLMHRTSLEPHHGMLFSWPDESQGIMLQDTGFWMKETPLPLTIIFAYEKKVVHVVRRAEPFSLTPLKPVDPNQKVDQVLEIDASHPRAGDVQIGWQLLSGE